MAKIGILGGTFDPIHNAHLEMAKCARNALSLDCVWFMPSKNPPHKQGREILSQEMRTDMVKLAIEEISGFYFSDFELRRDEISYTADTLELLQKKYPVDRFYFIMGGDSLFSFEKWYHPEIIAKKAVILAAGRNGIKKSDMEKQAQCLSERFGGEFVIVPMGEMEISSTMIRKKCLDGQSVKDYVPEKVNRYLLENMCYQKN